MYITFLDLSNKVKSFISPESAEFLNHTIQWELLGGIFPVWTVKAQSYNLITWHTKYRFVRRKWLFRSENCNAVPVFGQKVDERPKKLRLTSVWSKGIKWPKGTEKMKYFKRKSEIFQKILLYGSLIIKYMLLLFLFVF